LNERSILKSPASGLRYNPAVTLPCPNCGYDMRTQADEMLAPRCPECGSVFTRITLVHAGAWRPDSRLRHLNGAVLIGLSAAMVGASFYRYWLFFGLAAGAAGASIRVWAYYRGESWGWTMRVWGVAVAACLFLSLVFALPRLLHE
jgi:hypothetical protein